MLNFWAGRDSLMRNALVTAGNNAADKKFFPKDCSGITVAI
jgi:hypothetical protein